MTEKATKQDLEEFHYTRFKEALRKFNSVPESIGGVRAACSMLRKEVRIIYYGSGSLAILLGLVTLVIILGFIVLPVGIFFVFLGRRKIRRIRHYEARYISETFTASSDS